MSGYKDYLSEEMQGAIETRTPSKKQDFLSLDTEDIIVLWKSFLLLVKNLME